MVSWSVDRVTGFRPPAEARVTPSDIRCRPPPPRPTATCEPRDAVHESNPDVLRRDLQLQLWHSLKPRGRRNLRIALTQYAS